MPAKKIRLTIDSSVCTEQEREILASLHSLIVKEVSTMKLSEHVKVLLEMDPADTKVYSGLEYSGHEEHSISKLSKRQRQVVDMLYNHYSVKRIASELFVSENTVKKHIQNIKKTLKIEQSGSDFIYVLKNKLEQATPFG
jgi:DNA-binding NarL/FixJ family response regulator